MRKHAKPKKVVTRLDLARQVADLLDIPFNPHSVSKWKASPNQAVNAIFATIKKALLRGESVKIDGFGIFEPFRKKATRSTIFPTRYFLKGAYHEVVEIPAKTKAIFKPSKPLKRFINS